MEGGQPGVHGARAQYHVMGEHKLKLDPVTTLNLNTEGMNAQEVVN